MSRKVKIMIILAIDSVLITLANLFSYIYMKPFVAITTEVLVKALVIQLVLYWILGRVFKVFTRINRYTSLKELVAIFFALLISYIVEMGYFIFSGDVYSQRYIFFTYLLSMFVISASRVAWRILIEYNNNKTKDKRKQKNTIIVGAGAGGGILLNTLNTSMTNDQVNVVGIVDDATDKVGTLFYGSKVIGTTENLPELIKEYNVENVTIAIPSLKAEGFERILGLLEALPVTVNSMPSIEQIVNGDVSVTKLREVDVVDLLGRDEVKLDMESISSQLMDKTILVTGAGGSIGSEICRQVIRFNPRQLILVGHGENSIYLIEKELKTNYKHKTTKVIPIIADIQDRERIFELVKKYHPDIIYHAAAHKHVPLMEYNPSEAVKNNIYGTKNVAEAAKEHGVGSFVMISTDKANNPPNVMGATKRIAEMIVTSLNESGKTKFSAVRFGNVLGSRGSVVPLFKEQIEAGGPITVTDMRMTRYFMTIPEASRLVVQSGALASGGEIFILDMGEPVKISDLAKKMIKLSGYSEDDIKIIESGIRPGEKLYEELLVDKEKSPDQIYNKIFVGNISGFDFAEVWQFIQMLPVDDQNLSKELIKFANESSRC
ncbi:polysaccharide biosynthesis protein [Vagococcus sp. BWB3-3]|uniref:Polysaccharide biosynthesis protein n=1 Tax=Vagococcus allomyrinae TaxID=2794353 RepID=A0A940PGR7_9ENTE|nr:nucleoside-diphosphate sugar epimerase/dehydratase [Vagococcus allomyrinae]MBP1043653.1 polysaccharide biosynthesis protein [Vagococcus allomyrinae]